MPYRRLPNTDAARLKAMQEAMEKSSKMSPAQLALSQKSLQKLRYFLPSYKQALVHAKEVYDNQIQKSNAYHELQKTVKIYISHFIQVLNLAIVRGEFSEQIRSFYGLENYDKKMPTLNTEQELIDWGKKIIDGEALRTARGGVPMMNPRIALVKIKYDQYTEAQRNQKFIQTSYTRAHDKVVELRPQADEIILEIWNEVEGYFENLSAQEKRDRAVEYGIHYVHRPSEVEM